MDADLPEFISNSDDTYDIIDYQTHTRKRISGMEMREMVHARFDAQTKREMERLKAYTEVPDPFDFHELKDKLVAAVRKVRDRIKESGWTIKW